MIIHGGDSLKLKQRKHARNEPGARRNAIEQTQKRFAHHRVSVQRIRKMVNKAVFTVKHCAENGKE
jgi:hypothetical protein